MVQSPTTTVETVTVVRPLKVIALVCLVIALILLLVSLVTTSWLRTGGFRTGLFEECMSSKGDSEPKRLENTPAPGTCHGSSLSRVYVKIVAGMLILAGILTLAAVLLTVFGLCSSNYSRKYMWYKIATCLALLGVLLELVSLVVFPVCFYLEMKEWGRREWEFDWSYGVAWGATLFTFGASLMLICDKEHEEIYYKQKTVYHAP